MFSNNPSFYLIAVFIIWIAAGCTQDQLEDFYPDEPETMPNGVEVLPGILKINEFIANEPDTVSPYNGKKEEWFELYNPGDDTLILERNKWYLTDHGWDNPHRFRMRETLEIPPGGFFLIWCDNGDRFRLNPDGSIQSVHTNFSLASDGEHIAIYYEQDDGRLLLIDDYQYEAQRPGMSEGRSPDGKNNWKFFEHPTPNRSNTE